MIRQTLRNNGRVLMLQLASHKNRNALSLEMIRELQGILESNKNPPAPTPSQPPPRVIVLDHEGPAFSSGHDLKELLSNDAEQNEALFSECSNLMQSVVASPTPIIAKVNGVATAAGCQLVASCDLAYATANSKFATPGVNIGFFCSTPAVAVSRSVPAKKHVMEMLLTGKPISAKRAYEIGLINAVARDESELSEMVDELADIISKKSSKAIQAYGKPTFAKQAQMPLQDAYDVASQTMCDNLKEDDCLKGIRGFLDKKPIKW